MRLIPSLNDQSCRFVVDFRVVVALSLEFPLVDTSFD